MGSARDCYIEDGVIRFNVYTMLLKGVIQHLEKKTDHTSLEVGSSRLLSLY